jgi:RNA polymerase sigma factor (sigma-70 family)
MRMSSVSLEPWSLAAPGESLDAYLRRLQAIPLLAPAEEAALAARIAAGDAAAAQQLAYHNLRLAASRALRAARRPAGWLAGADPDTAVWDLGDAVQAANLGLWAAVWRFDPAAHGTRFSTYAVWWITQSLQRLVEPWQHPIPVPVHEHAALRQLQQAQARLTQTLGRAPTHAELAAACGWPLAAVTAREAFLATRLLSLDAPLAADAPDLIPADVAADPRGSLWDQLEARLRADAVRAALATLPPRTAAIVQAYFGLDDDHPRTLRAVGRLFGVSGERVRQVIARALDTLRHDPAAQAALAGWDA